jgi:hypothetical protein
MPDIPADPVEVEKLVRGLLVTLFSGIEGLPNVHPHRLWIENEAEAVRKMGYTHPANSKTEFRVLVIDFEPFEDTKDGCDDDPVYNLVYRLKLAVSYSDKRPDNSTSTDDFARFAMTMRARVLSNRQFNFAEAGEYDRLRCENLEAVSFDPFGEDEETLIRGPVGEFSLKVRVTPYG